MTILETKYFQDPRIIIWVVFFIFFLTTIVFLFKRLRDKRNDDHENSTDGYTWTWDKTKEQKPQTPPEVTTGQHFGQAAPSSNALKIARSNRSLIKRIDQSCQEHGEKITKLSQSHAIILSGTKQELSNLEGEMSAQSKRLLDRIQLGEEEINRNVRNLHEELGVLRAESVTRIRRDIERRKNELILGIEDLKKAAGDHGGIGIALMFASEEANKLGLTEFEAGAQRLIVELKGIDSSGSIRKIMENHTSLIEMLSVLKKCLRKVSEGETGAVEYSTKWLMKNEEPMNVLIAESRNMIPIDEDLYDNLKEIRSRFLREVEREYIKIVTDRGNDQHLTRIEEIMKHLNLEIIEVSVGESQFDSRSHDATGRSEDSSKRPNTIVDIVSMGYHDLYSSEIVKAKVVTNGI